MFKYKVFSTNNNNYLFDGVSSNIFNIDDIIYKNHEYLFSNIEKENTSIDSELLESYKNIKECIDSGALKPKSDNEFEYWFDIKQYKENFNEEVKHLLIGLTEKCNLRCKYCIYGGHYENERTHNEVDMDFNILKQSIDKFFKTSQRKNKVINLYGGEPFINFRAMKNIVEYINSIDDNVSIYITTNGTLLKDEVLNWLIENKNVNLFVSFAGTPSTHDKLRVFINNQPTYNIIRNNLLKLRELSEETYIDRINFIFNLFSEFQLIEIQEHWETDELFKGVQRKPEITYIDCFDDDGYVKSLSEDILKNYDKSVDPLNEYIELIKNKNYDNLIVKNYDEKFLNIHRRELNNDKNILAGVCRPIVQKTFVDVNGNIHLCENFICKDRFDNIENISSLSDCFGDIDNLLYEYKKERINTCDSCWANKLCRLCFKDTIDSTGKINNKHTIKSCKEERESLLENLIEYCTVLENGEDLLEHLDEYIIYE